MSAVISELAMRVTAQVLAALVLLIILSVLFKLTITETTTTGGCGCQDK